MRTFAILLVTVTACIIDSNSDPSDGGGSDDQRAYAIMQCNEIGDRGGADGCGPGPDCTQIVDKTIKMGCLTEEIDYNDCILAEADVCAPTTCNQPPQDKLGPCIDAYCEDHPADPDCPKPPAP